MNRAPAIPMKLRTRWLTAWAGWAVLYGFCLLMLLFLAAPIAIVIIVSFSDASFVYFPPPGFSTRWYAALLEYDGFIDSFLRVTLPLIKPGLMPGGIFAFIISFDNYTISMWLKSAESTPLPLKLFCMVENVMNSSVAAASASMIFLPVLLIVITEKVVGLRRAMSV